MPRLAVSLPIDSLVAYTGNYELTDNKAFKAHLKWDGDQLLLNWNTDKPVEVYAEKKDFFFIKPYDLQLTFSRDTAGKINGFTARTGGKSFVYQKIP